MYEMGREYNVARAIGYIAPKIEKGLLGLMSLHICTYYIHTRNSH